MKVFRFFTLIALILGFGVSRGEVFAEEIRIDWINPVYRSVSPDKVPMVSKTLRGETVYVTSYTEFKAALLEKAINRITQVNINVSGLPYDEVKTFPERYNKESEAEEPYTFYNIYRWSVNINGMDGNVTISYTLIYWTTVEQEQYVSQRVPQILGEIITSGMNDEQKLKAIHDWVVKNVQYDTNPDPSLAKHSAYDALFSHSTVCQGYALLTFRMLKDSGVSARIVSGKAWDSQQNKLVEHAWNLVRLCGNWYHTDATWDDPIPDDPSRILYIYYNKTDIELESKQDHTWIKANYPSVSSVSYVEGLCTLTLADVIEGLRVLTGIPPLAALRLIDINGDGKIGPEEIVHALQKIAGLR